MIKNPMFSLDLSRQKKGDGKSPFYKHRKGFHYDKKISHTAINLDEFSK